MLIYLQMIDSPEERSKFEALYLLYKDALYSVAYRILQNADDAEDAVHNAFLNIVENISKIGEVDCLKTRSYIVTIVESRAIDVYRHKKAHPTVPYDEESVGITVEQEDGSDLARCILTLPSRQRQVIIMKYHHGYELKEIAKMLGITYCNALAIEQRAKKKLRTLCQEAELI